MKVWGSEETREGRQKRKQETHFKLETSNRGRDRFSALVLLLSLPSRLLWVEECAEKNDVAKESRVGIVWQQACVCVCVCVHWGLNWNQSVSMFFFHLCLRSTEEYSAFIFGPGRSPGAFFGLEEWDISDKSRGSSLVDVHGFHLWREYLHSLIRQEDEWMMIRTWSNGRQIALISAYFVYN